jgi:hypothetical protein
MSNITLKGMQCLIKNILITGGACADTPDAISGVKAG